MVLLSALSHNLTILLQHCLLHSNELPLQEIFKALYGATKNPDTYSREIESYKWNCFGLGSCLLYFKPIHLQPQLFKLRNTVIDEFNADQYHRYRVCMAVMLGPSAMNKNLELLEVGGFSFARWPTSTCHMFWYYASVEAAIKTAINIC